MLSIREQGLYDGQVEGALKHQTAYDLARDSVRYHFLRQMTPEQFAAFHARWLAAKFQPFYWDEMIDEAVARQHSAPIAETQKNEVPK